MSPPAPLRPDNADSIGPSTHKRCRPSDNEDEQAANGNTTSSSVSAAQMSLPPSPSPSIHLPPNKLARRDPSTPPNEVSHADHDLAAEAPMELDITPSPSASPADDSCAPLCQWDDCGMVLASKEALVDHIKLDHVGIAEGSSKCARGLGYGPGGFQCHWANCQHTTGFKAWSHLHRHIKKHCRYRPFVCENCTAAAAAAADPPTNPYEIHLRCRRRKAKKAKSSFPPDDTPMRLIGRRLVKYEFYEERRYNEHTSLYHQTPSTSRRRKHASLILPRSQRFQHAVAAAAVTPETLTNQAVDPTLADTADTTESSVAAAAAVAAMAIAEASVVPTPPESSSATPAPLSTPSPTPSSSGSSSVATPADQTPHYFPCHYPGCTMKYVHEARLNDHINADHKGILRWVCNVPTCAKRFPHSASLSRHQRTHTQEEVRQAKRAFVLPNYPAAAAAMAAAGAGGDALTIRVPKSLAKTLRKRNTSSLSTARPLTLAPLPTVQQTAVSPELTTVLPPPPPAPSVVPGESTTPMSNLLSPRLSAQPDRHGPSPPRLPSGMEELLSRRSSMSSSQEECLENANQMRG
ncbi:hypothetical protein BGZ73_006979 [Actinomortierella ambigua]|nr:hypothetical protein BGZ73_006979 [Actinomortierella ambigua]